MPTADERDDIREMPATPVPCEAFVPDSEPGKYAVPEMNSHSENIFTWSLRKANDDDES